MCAIPADFDSTSHARSRNDSSRGNRGESREGLADGAAVNEIERSPRIYREKYSFYKRIHSVIFREFRADIDDDDDEENASALTRDCAIAKT